MLNNIASRQRRFRSERDSRQSRASQENRNARFHGRCGKSPNDLKLSDRRGWRDRCVADGKAAAEAAGVTAAPVRCSAWLAVSFQLEFMSGRCRAALCFVDYGFEGGMNQSLHFSQEAFQLVLLLVEFFELLHVLAAPAADDGSSDDRLWASVLDARLQHGGRCRRDWVAIVDGEDINLDKLDFEGDGRLAGVEGDSFVGEKRLG